MFFGAPHKGIRTEALEAMVADKNFGSRGRSEKLLRVLARGSDYLQEHAESTKVVWKGRRIVSFFETMKTEVVIKVPCAPSAKAVGKLEGLTCGIGSGY